ncbi:MAG: hypothetical protein Tp1124DCM108671_25 [Prokaryotic dsDNA virus sp.]|nr:MAG: hypothetical protein Tp1125DCM102451_45 [Prokaryotic dsDNA virus sp.]QDP65582.1 MAG: hypothetical protein Tp1124DCM108671_25 [Prokaryotic dsDNA virus sp.]|tara:strand:- start:3526 stop:4446 length:921 start_codon:yes stop_codon:yes gene_type:complete
MGFSITSNYAGDHAGQYIGAALRSAKTLENVTVLENVKYKRNITKVATASLIKDATCDFTDAGTITLTERVLNPKELQINVDLCKKDVLADWQVTQTSAGAHNRGLGDDFAAFIMAHLAGTISDWVEQVIWTGNDSDPGSVTGWMTAGGVGTIDADTAVVEADNSGGAGTAHSATNIDENLGLLMASVPITVYGKEDLYIYMGSAAYRLYLENQANAGYQQLYSMNDAFVPMYNGTKIAMCPGFPANKMVAAQKSNMFFGTDLLSDTTEIRMLDMGALDGSDNLRVVAKFTAGVQHGQGGDIVRQD